MFAVIKTGGKQYRVAANDVLTLDKLEAEAGATVTFPVLMLGGEEVAVGAPVVEGASVTAEVVEQTRGKKVIAFKKRRRQNSRRKRGFRAELTTVRITEISGLGKTVKAEASDAAGA
ncbi:50S ribosomal protein L21 [Xanthobacter sp. TB0139]|uniref:50S ribosomal protein L21 n=1 Tax=Xanthobacter sp. TB0139 TaxID=3459178 RepID=UPI004039FD86